MGYAPDDFDHKGIGPRFANKIFAQDVILIARRDHNKPHVVGFGVVRDKGDTHPIRGLKTPNPPGSWHILEPFIAQNRPLPTSVPFISALKHTMALAQLHPEENLAQWHVCEWLWKQLSRKSKRAPPGYTWIKTNASDSKNPQNAKESRLRWSRQLGYKFQTHEQIQHAWRNEQQLIQRYENWLAGKRHSLVTYKYQGNLACDAIEKERLNLIEAKSSNKREYVRMAVGQLLDYEFQGKSKMNKAILVPDKPRPDIERWLKSLKIGLIWPVKQRFQDNASGNFT